MPLPPYLPTLHGKLLTGREVLENAATAASIFVYGLDDPAIVHDITALMARIRSTTDEKHRRLIESLYQLMDQKVSPAGFLGCVIIACELSLFGSLIPGMPTAQPRAMNWDDLHPAWRFVRLHQELDRSAALRRRFWGATSDEIEGLCDHICDCLGWSRWSGLVRMFTPKRYGPLKGTFPHGWTQFLASMTFRKERHGCFFSPILGLARTFKDAVQEWNPQSGESFHRYLEQRIRRCMIPQKFRPPVLFESAGKPTFNAALGKEDIGFCSAYYYLSHFAEKMVFDDNLNYPIELFPHESVVQMFAEWFGFPPERVFKFDVQQGVDRQDA